MKKIRELFKLKTTVVKKEDSLKKRYLYKISSNIIGIPISFLMMLIIPRGLGAERYGDFNFLTNFFTQLSNFFNFNTSLGFYTKISKTPKNNSLISFYLSFFAFTTFLMLLFILTVIFINGYQTIWHNQNVQFIWMGFFWGILYQLNQIINNILDAHGLTVKSEKAIIKQKIIGLGTLGFLFFLGKINLHTFFIYHFFMFFIIYFLWWKVLKQNNIKLFSSKSLSKKKIKRYILEFYEYSHPLFIYSCFALVAGIGDRWFLQSFSGSIEQGYYSFALKFSAVIFLLSKSMTPLFMREFTIALDKKDNPKIRNLFHKLLPQFYFIAAFISIYFYTNSEIFSLLVAGKEFQEASSSVAIMAFYPIHQALGQLSGSIYYASGRTKIYSQIGILGMITGLIFSFIFMGPKKFGVLDLAAIGLALKMVINQVFTVNLHLWYNCKFLKVSFLQFLSYQVITLLSLMMSAFLTKSITVFLTSSIPLQIFLSISLYSFTIFMIIYIFPSTIKMSREELNSYILIIQKKLFFRDS